MFHFRQIKVMANSRFQVDAALTRLMRINFPGMKVKNAGLIEGTLDGPRSCYCINWKAFEKFTGDINSLFTNLKAKNEKACC